MALVTEGTKLVVKHSAPKTCLCRSHKSWIEIEFGGGGCTDKNRKSPTIRVLGLTNMQWDSYDKKRQKSFVVYRA